MLERVAGAVRAEIPYAAAGWILIDPDTTLMNAVYGEDVDREHHLELITLELTEPDVNKFWELADRGIAAAALSATTDGELARSPRWARVYGPNGYGDELRAVFLSGGIAWGHACLTRTSEDPFFSTSEVDLVAAIAPHVGNGIRTCHLLGDLVKEPCPRAGVAPALVVLAADGSVEQASDRVDAWLGPPDDPSMRATMVLHEVAGRARALAAGEATGPPAMARVRARTGEWLVVRAAHLSDDPGGSTALVVEPARRSDLAPLVLDLHQLTDRERHVTQLLLTGRSTAEIADELYITSETLRGHVKSVYAKLGVSSRPEMAAMLSHEPRSRVRPVEPAAPRSR